MKKIYELNAKEINQRKNSLIKIINLLKKKKINYFLESGVLLGLYRDKKLLPWDNDIEIGIKEIPNEKYLENILKILSQLDYKIMHVDPSLKNFKISFYKHDHTKFSICGYYKSKNFYLRKMSKYPVKFFDNLTTIKLDKHLFRCPKDIEGYLQWQYVQWKVIKKSRDAGAYMSKLSPRKYNILYNIILNKLGRFTKNFLKLFFGTFIISHEREKNFKTMLLNSIFNSKIFFEIGSNDGDEFKFLRNKKVNFKWYLYEANKKNINYIKKKIQPDSEDHKIFNIGISHKEYTGKLYLSGFKGNLSTNQFLKNTKSIKTKFIKLQDALKKNNIKKSITIKMDLEGQEYDILNSSFDYLKKIKNLNILIELHPIKYKNLKMKKLFKKLFFNGFRPVMVESAAKPIPLKFNQSKLKPLIVNQNRGLYVNVSKSFLLNYAFTITPQIVSNNKKGFSDKIIRSILITNNPNFKIYI